MNRANQVLCSIVLVAALVALTSSIAAAAPPPTANKPQPGLRRFALVVGANHGGQGRVTLRFAGSDARAFSRVLKELGGAAPSDLEVLVDPTMAAVEAGFASLAPRMAAARVGGRRVELIVYYSGHSDEEGLLLGGQRLSYDDLRERIRQMPADVQIAILDSCASGAFTRSKGGKRLPAFLVDESHQVHGHAFLSSSSADEQAQESDRLGGSFFTHAFVGGLRGAADANRDGRVTLSEAYQFAYSETLSRTQNTRFGAQHPGYEMHLVGTGDVILTDLRSTGAAVILAEDVSGRIFVRGRDQALFLELTKQADSPRLLGLPPDTYDIVVDTGDRRTTTRVVVRQGQRITVALADLRELRPEESVARGGPPGLVADAEYQHSPLHLDLFHIPGAGDRTSHFVALNLLVGGGARLEGLEIGGLANIRTERATGAQIAGIANLVEGPAGLQIAGITNWTKGPVSLGQIGGIINWSGGADGFQIGGIANVATGPTGLQIGGIANMQRGGDAGLQVAGIINWTNGTAGVGQIGGIASWANKGIEGFQLSGIASVSGGAMRGVQIAGITNQARGDVRGLQIAGINNATTGDVRGAQLSLVNIGGAVSGAQIGLLNVARRIDGLQLGLVNVATESNANGVPIGLLSVAPDGRYALEAWLADAVHGRVGLKLGSQRLYTLIAVGFDNDYLAAGGGLGVHAGAERFYIDVDLAMYEVRDTSFHEAEGVDSMAEARAMVGFPIGSGFSVFGGVSATGTMSWDRDDPARDITVFTVRDVGDPGDRFTMKIAPGLFAGTSY